MRKITILLLLTVLLFGSVTPMSTTAVTTQNHRFNNGENLPSYKGLYNSQPKLDIAKFHMYETRSTDGFYTNIDLTKPDRNSIFGIGSQFSRQLPTSYKTTSLGLDQSQSAEIFINGNDDLKQFPGSGTLDDPYVISGYQITSNIDILVIQNTDAYVLVYNNYFSGMGSGENDGIQLFNVANIKISTNTILQTGIGIAADGATNLGISSNTVSQNYIAGIQISSSNNGVITGNTLSLNVEGLLLYYTTEFAIEGNTINYNDMNGMTLTNSDFNTVIDNTVEWNGVDGVFLVDSNHNQILANSLLNNGFYYDECARGCGPNIQTTYYSGEFPGQFSNAYTAEGRIGDSAYGKDYLTYEMDMSSSVDGPFGRGETANFLWPSGVAVPFSIDYSSETYGVTLTLNGTRSVTHYTEVPLSTLNDILIRTRADNPYSTVRLSDIVLNYDYNLNIIAESSIEMGDINTVEINTDGLLWNELHLSGNVMLDWSQTDSVPINSSMSFQISFGNVVNPVALSSLNEAQLYSGSFGLGLDAGYRGAGIFIDPSVDNVVENNTASGNAAVGVYLQSSNNTLVKTNDINNNLIYGLFLEDSNSNTITGNNVELNGGSSQLAVNSALRTNAGYRGAGIFIDPSVDNVVDNNSINNNDLGLYLYQSDRTMIKNNIMDSNGIYGLFLEDSDTNTVAGNAITNNGLSAAVFSTNAGYRGAGIFIDPSTANTVEENYIANNYNGLYLFQSDHTDISKNNITSNGIYGLFLENSNTNNIVENAVTNNGGTSAVNLKLNAGYRGAGIFIDPSTDNHVEGNYIANNDVGLHLLQSDLTNITSNTISSNGAYGVFLENSDKNSISANIIHDNGATVALGLETNAGYRGAGIFIDPSSDNSVDNNYIAGSDLGLYLLDSNTTSITNNELTLNGIYGLLLNASDANYIAGNKVTDNGYSATTLGVNAGYRGAGIFIDPSSENVVEGNIINDNVNGLYLLQSDQTNIKENLIDSNGVYGLFLENSNANSIVGNSVTNNGGSTAAALGVNAGYRGAGIFIDPSTDNVIKDNYVNNNEVGVHVLESDNTEISNNVIDSNGMYGVVLENSDNNDLTDNEVTNNGGSFDAVGLSVNAGYRGAGIFIDPSFGNTISGNVITQNIGDGLFSEASENTMIEGNHFANNEYYGVNLDGTTKSTTVKANNFFKNGVDLTGSQARDDNPDLTNLFELNFFDDADLTDRNHDGIADNPYMIDGDASNTDETPVVYAYIIAPVEVELSLNPGKIVTVPSKNPYYMVVTLPDHYVVSSVDVEKLFLNETINPVSAKIGSFKDDGKENDHHSDDSRHHGRRDNHESDPYTQVTYTQFRLKFKSSDILNLLMDRFGDQIQYLGGKEFTVKLVLTGQINDGLVISGSVSPEVKVPRAVVRWYYRLPVSNFSIILGMAAMVTAVRFMRKRKI